MSYHEVAVTGSSISQAELSSMLNAFSQPAAVLSDDYKIVAVNSAYQEAYSELESPTDKHCYQVSHGYDKPCDQAGESCPLQKCQATGLRQCALHLHHTRYGQAYVDLE